MKSFSIAATLAYAGGVAAFWRMPCRSQTGLARIDPLVDPGVISSHVHTITGGGGFGMNANFSTLTAEGSCTACEVKQDHSAYWTPALYFQYANGSTALVQQIGGMLAYYLYYLKDVVAFPEGFAMIAGNPAYRNFSGPFPDTELSFWPTDPTDQFFLEQRALGFNCLNYARTPEPSLYRHYFPTKDQLDNDCKDGLRLELAFPSCGKSGEIDSEDHKSHMAYPSLVKEGNCPEGYDVHYPFLFFETIWATNEFAGLDGQFVLSTGDPIGTSYHGDFIMGWESEEFLQAALDTCKNPSGEIEDCPLFLMQDDSVGAQCTFDVPEELKDEECHGSNDGLPVDVPIQSGPEPATKYAVAGANNVPTSSIAKSTGSATYSVTKLPYSAANPTMTSTAQGGIVAAPSHAASKAHEEAPADVASTISPSTTEAPDYSPVTSPADAASTTYMTKGNEVIEMVIEEVAVTVTAAAPHDPKHKRHMDYHQQNRMH